MMAGLMLNSPHAVEMSIFVVRAFVRTGETLASYKELATHLDALETRIERKLNTHD